MNIFRVKFSSLKNTTTMDKLSKFIIPLSLLPLEHRIKILKDEIQRLNREESDGSLKYARNCVLIATITSSELSSIPGFGYVARERNFNIIKKLLGDYLGVIFVKGRNYHYNFKFEVTDINYSCFGFGMYDVEITLVKV